MSSSSSSGNGVAAATKNAESFIWSFSLVFKRLWKQEWIIICVKIENTPTSFANWTSNLLTGIIDHRVLSLHDIRGVFASRAPSFFSRGHHFPASSVCFSTSRVRLMFLAFCCCTIPLKFFWCSVKCKSEHFLQLPDGNVVVIHSKIIEIIHNLEDIFYVKKLKKNELSKQPTRWHWPFSTGAKYSPTLTSSSSPPSEPKRGALFGPNSLRVRASASCKRIRTDATRQAASRCSSCGAWLAESTEINWSSSQEVAELWTCFLHLIKKWRKILDQGFSEKSTKK